MVSGLRAGFEQLEEDIQTHDELMDRNMFFFFTDQPPSDIHLYRDVLETCILNQIDLQRKLGTTMCISSTLNDLYDLAESYIKKSSLQPLKLCQLDSEKTTKPKVLGKKKKKKKTETAKFLLKIQNWCDDQMPGGQLTRSGA
jgi:hypothetical protein